MIGNLLLRHRKLVPCPKPASACSSAPRRHRPRWLIFSASISKRQTSKSSIEFLIGVIQERSSESQWKILFLELISQHHHAIVAVLRTHVRRRLEQFQVGGGR